MARPLFAAWLSLSGDRRTTRLIQIEEKERMRAREKRSPDRADMLMMLMGGGGEEFVNWMTSREAAPSAAELMRREMKGW